MVLTKKEAGLSKSDSMCLKGIAIFIMMFFHCFCSTRRIGDYTVDFFPFTQNFFMNFSRSFNICVSIFAFITGYGLYLSCKNKCVTPRDNLKWTANRYIKTFSGYWFVYVISFIVTMCYCGYPIEKYFGKGIGKGLSYIAVDFLGLFDLFSTPTLNGTWWYMSAALIFILFVPIALKITKKTGYIPLILFLIILPRLLLEPGAIDGTNPYAFLITVLFGMLFAQYDVFNKVLNIKLVKNRIADSIIQFVLWTALLAVSIYFWIRFEQKYFFEYHFAFQPLISIIYCRKYIVRIPVIKEILAFFGKHSMNIFLVHSFFRSIFFADFTYSFKYFWLIGIVLFSISLLISICLQLLKRIFFYDKLMDKLSDKITAALS